ncbi:MAG: hypothetical protein ABSA22_06750 [Acidimicrobiales bacterium]
MSPAELVVEMTFPAGSRTMVAVGDEPLRESGYVIVSVEFAVTVVDCGLPARTQFPVAHPSAYEYVVVAPVPSSTSLTMPMSAPELLYAM